MMSSQMRGNDTNNDANGGNNGNTNNTNNINNNNNIDNNINRNRETNWSGSTFYNLDEEQRLESDQPGGDLEGHAQEHSSEEVEEEPRGKEGEEPLANPIHSRTKRHRRTQIRIASWNMNRALLTKLANVCADATANKIDMVLLQDVGIKGKDAKSTLATACRAASDLGFRFMAKSYVPAPDAGYTEAELTKLRELYTKGSAEEEGQSYRDELAVLVRNDLAQYVVTIPSGLPGSRYQHVALIGRGSTINVVNVYMPPAGLQTEEAYRSCVETAMAKARDLFNTGEDVIMGGDWNAVTDATQDREPARQNNAQDESLRISARANSMTDVATIWDQRNLRTYRHRDGNGRLDTFFIPDLNSRHVSAITIPYGSDSDHSLIFCDIKWDRHTEATPPPPPPYKYAVPSPPKGGWNFEEPEWKRFRKKLAEEATYEKLIQWKWMIEDIDHVNREAHITTAVEEITGALQNAAVATFGWAGKKKKRRPFYTKGVRAAWTKRRAIRHWVDYLRNPKAWKEEKMKYCKRALRRDLDNSPMETKEETIQALRNLDKALRREIDAEIRRTKAENWETYKNDQQKAQAKQSGRSFQPFTRHQKGKALGVIRTRDGETCVTASSRLQAIEQHLSDIHQRAEPDLAPHGSAGWEAFEGHKAPAAELRLDITSAEIEEIWKHIPPNKAPGYDGITMAMLKAAPTDIQSLVKSLIKTTITTKIIPPSWKRIRMIMLHKSGDATKLDNYRAIALAPIMLRIADKVINFISQQQVEALGLLSPWQFGFRRRKTTYQAQIIMDQIIDHAKRSEQDLYIIMLDIRKAFPSVVWSLMWRRIRAMRLTDLGDYVEKLYPGMQFDVYTPFGITTAQPFRAGIFEGLSTSPMLFSIFINPLLEWMTARRVKGYTMIPTQTTVHMVSFADDGTVYQSSRMAAEETLEEIARFGHHNNANINAKKTVVVSTEKDNRIAFEIPARYVHPMDRTGAGDRCTIQHQGPEFAFRSLGIFRSLNHASLHHLDTIRGRAEHVFYNLERIPATWTHTVRILESLITPQLTYAAGLVQFDATFLEGLDRRARRILKRNGKASRRLRSEVLELEPLSGRRSFKQSVYAATLNSAISSIRQSREVSTIIRANMIAAAGDFGYNTTPWAYPHCRCGGTQRGYIDHIRERLLDLSLRAAWTEGQDVFNHHLRRTIFHCVAVFNEEMWPHQPGILTITQGMASTHKLKNKALSEVERSVSVFDNRKIRGHLLNDKAILEHSTVADPAANRQTRAAWNRWKATCAIDDHIKESLLTPLAPGGWKLIEDNQHTTIILHTPDLRTTIDSSPGEAAKGILDQRSWEKAKMKNTLDIYIANDAHEETWLMPRKHPQGLIIWDGRLDNWATAVKWREWGIHGETGRCNCSPTDETIEHILRHCKRYTHTRQKSGCPYYSNQQLHLKYLLGFIDKEGQGEFGNMEEGQRIKHANEAVKTSLEIWAERGRSDKRRQAYVRQQTTEENDGEL